MNEKEFKEKFEDLSLPAEVFNHIAHIRIGWIYIRDNNFEIACDKLNSGIRQYALSLGAKDKYHHTLTTAFAYIIRDRIKDEQTFEEFLKNNEDLEKDALKIISHYYSNDLLNSKKAKEDFVLPDKKSFS